ncbi:hypothetical protein Tco_1391022 [Tanacetum coccineum]
MDSETAHMVAASKMPMLKPVPPPHPLIYNAPTKLDLSYSGLDEFKEPKFVGYRPRKDKQVSNLNCDKTSDENSDDSLQKQQVSDDESSFVESLLKVVENCTVFDTPKKIEFVKPKLNEKPVKRTVRVDNDYYAKTSHPITHRTMPPRVVNIARPIYTSYPKPTVNCARQTAHFSKQAQSTVYRPFYNKTAYTNMYSNQKVNTVRPRVVNTARPYRVPLNTVRGYAANAVKSSACWIWRPTRSNGASLGNPHLNDKGFVDSGCSRHMTGNKAYLSDFKEFDGGYVTFEGGAYGGKISGKDV